MKKVIIIGGGVSGMFCANFIKKFNQEIEVTIIEKEEELGKKILATGNGKCNFTNTHLLRENLNELSHYNDNDFVRHILYQFDADDTINYLTDIGLLSKIMYEDRLYPYNEQAISMRNVLLNQINKNKVILKTGEKVLKILKNNQEFIVKTSLNEYQATDIVIACGGKSSSFLGSDGSIYPLLENLGIGITKTIPGLTGIKKVNWPYKVLDGTRVKANLKVYFHEEELFSEDGEVQFKKDGISGIVVMNAQSTIARSIINYHVNLKDFKIVLDLTPELTDFELNNYLSIQKNNSNIYGILSGIVPNSLAKAITFEVKGQNLEKYVYALKHFEIELADFYDYATSQVTIGGVDLGEVNSETLEVVSIPHLYIGGENLDIDGDCGGYNIQWAISSAYVVAKTIGEYDVQSK